MKFRPIGPRVYIAIEPEPEMTPGGIVIPEHLRKKAPVTRVKVLAVGEGYHTSGGVVPCEVKPGDIALMPWRIGADQGDCRVVPEAELLGVIS
jgi:co-chaperonin GroES (HSP10)